MNRRHFVASFLTALMFVAPTNRAYASTQLTSEPEPHTPAVATPSATADITVENVDIRDVFARPWKYRDMLIRFAGIVHEMRVAPPGNGFRTGDEMGTSLFRTQMLVEVAFEQGNLERVLIVCDFDPEEVHRGVSVEIVAVHGGTHREPAEGGGFWEWPLFVATTIEPVAESQEP